MLKFYTSVLVLFVCTTSISCLSEEMQELADMLHNTCVGETGVSEDLIDKCKEGVFADDDKLKCYIKCIMLQMACISEDGIIDVEATVAVLPDEYRAKAEPIIRKCGTKVGKDSCENAWLTHQCYQQASPESYFLV